MKTLKEKFNIISCNDCDMPYCDIKCTTLSFMELDKLEQIAEDFAIDFLHWYLNNDDVKKFSYSYEDLLKDFKKEKGL
jgi:hypothetical protein